MTDDEFYSRSALELLQGGAERVGIQFGSGGRLQLSDRQHFLCEMRTGLRGHWLFHHCHLFRVQRGERPMDRTRSQVHLYSFSLSVDFSSATTCKYLC